MRSLAMSALPPKADIRIAAKKHRYSITVWRDGFVIALLMPYTDVEAQPNTRGRLVRPAAYEETASSTTS